MNTATQLNDELSPLVTPFLKGVEETFKVQCSLKVGVKEVSSLVAGSTGIDIAATSPVEGRDVRGNVSLCFSGPVFLKVMGKMLGEEFESLEDIADGAAELLNIVFGRAKRLLNLDGHEIKQAIPSVATGGEVDISFYQRAATTVVTFSSPVGEFRLFVAVDNAG